MPGTNCVVVGCTARKSKNRGLSFHHLPVKNHEWRMKLLNVIKSTRADPINEKNLTICSRHFEIDCFVEHVSTSGKVRRFLRPESLPTLNMPVKSITTPKPSSRPPPKIRSILRENEPLVDFDTFLNAGSSHLPEGWFVNKKKDQCELFKVQDGKVFYFLRITPCFNFDLYIKDYYVPNFKFDKSNFSSLSTLISYLENSTMCIGVLKEKLQDLANLVPGKNDNCFRHVELSMNVGNKIEYNSCVRSVACDGLMKSKGNICSNCNQVERNLTRKYERKHKNIKTIISTKTPLHKVSKAVVSKALKESRKAEKKMNHQLSTIRKRLSKEEINIDSNDLHNSFYDILESNTLKDPFIELFWKEQKSAFSKEDHGHRWHPMMVRLAILLHSQSPAAYRSLRDIGVLKLPGESTLRDFTNYIKPSPGFQPEVLLEIKQAADGLPDNQKWVTLLHDEMSIKSDLVFDKQTGNVVGFLNTAGKPVTSLKSCVATHCLVFMVVGVNSNLKYSLAWFPTTSASSSDIYSLFWEAVCHLETYCKLKVIAATSDKASANMQFYSLHGDTEGITNKTINLFAVDRYIYFFSDAPHLIKTIRNNMVDCRGNSKNLWKDGHYISWQHIKDLYIHDSERDLSRPTKLSHAHIYLNSYSVMKVNLAAQVLSHSVGKVLEAFGGEKARETSKFILLVDRFFDCLNVRSMEEGVRKRKPDLKPLKSVDDDRFKFLMDEFLGYIEEWKSGVENREGFTKAEKSKMFLTHQTYKGIVITAKSAVEASQYLLKQGVDFVLTNKFCQDPLEEHFGRHRALGRRSDNPTVNEFGYQENKLRLQRSLSLQIRPSGNVKRKAKPIIGIDNTPLKKRKQMKSLQ